MSDDESKTCTCPPDSWLLSCDRHWEVVAAALTREVELLGTTTKRAIPAGPYTEQETTNG